MSKCCFCKKEYEGYVVMMCSEIECFLIEEWIKDIYYSESDTEDIGICEKCREKKIWRYPMEQLRMFMGVRLQLMVAEDRFKEKDDTKMVKDCQDAISRLKKCEVELEALPEVQTEYRKNNHNPAAYKENAPKGTKCIYCGENEGQLWINNPNNDWTSESCWWVCKTCKKVIELQKQQSMHRFIKYEFEKINIDTSSIDKEIVELDKEIDAIAYEDGQVVASFEISKKPDGKLDVKKKRYG